MSEKMKNKTCGECRHLESIEPMGLCKTMVKPLCLSKLPACSNFEQKVITNGDIIRQGGDEALIAYSDKIYCDVCAYCDVSDNAFAHCHCPEGKECEDGRLAWLNAPADCVKQNGVDDTQPDLRKADYTESEVEDDVR